MSKPTRMLVVLLSLLAQSVWAQEKPLAKLGDSRRAALVRARYTPVPFTVGPRGDLSILVEGTVGAERVKFKLDSGYRDTAMLDLAVAKRLHLELGEEEEVTGAGGRTPFRKVTFPGLTLGSYDVLKDWPRLLGLAGDLSGVRNRSSPTGMLGSWALHEWAAVVDYPHKVLYLRPWLLTAWPKLAGTWTVTSWQEEGATRQIDPMSPPEFAFADRRLTLTDGGRSREYAIQLIPSFDIGVDIVRLFDPKQEGKPASFTLAHGLIKMSGGRMTACLALDAKKSKERPANFAAPKGSGYVLLELKRTTPAQAQETTDPLRGLLVKDGYTAVPLEQGADGMRVVSARIGQHALRLLVDTGASFSAFDAARLDKWGARRLGKSEGASFGGRVQFEAISLRGMRLGGYDTRRVWMAVSGGGLDMAGLNKALAEKRLPPWDGLLGNLDLLNGSAVLDFGTNTLYLRPVKETLWPQLEGKLVGVKYESDGRKGQYAPGDAALEFKDGRIRFITKDGTAEWGFHLRDEGDHYRVGLFDSKADELADGFEYSSSGLLKLAGGNLTLVIERGRLRREPTAFAAPKGSGLLLVEYERVK